MKPLIQSILIVFLISLTGLIWTDRTQAHPDFGCGACHVPHNSDADPSVPMWNPGATSTTLTDYYDSSTMDATVGPVNGASKLCLSCHDGTHPDVDAQHTVTSLANSHPVSFVYDQQLAIDDGQLVNPTTLASGVLDVNSRLQCSSCHDIHATAFASPNLRWANDSTFCLNCHAM